MLSWVKRMVAQGDTWAKSYQSHRRLRQEFANNKSQQLLISILTPPKIAVSTNRPHLKTTKNLKWSRCKPALASKKSSTRALVIRSKTHRKCVSTTDRKQRKFRWPIVGTVLMCLRRTLTTQATTQKLEWLWIQDQTAAQQVTLTSSCLPLCQLKEIQKWNLRFQSSLAQQLQSRK